jgi:hypothetical protein
MIRMALHAGVFAATVLAGSITTAALSSSPDVAAPTRADTVITRAFNTVATIPVGSAHLRAALANARRDRLPTLSTDRAVRAATLEIGSEVLSA